MGINFLNLLGYMCLFIELIIIGNFRMNAILQKLIIFLKGFDKLENILKYTKTIPCARKHVIGKKKKNIA